MTDTDDERLEHDLEAWAPPAPPAGLAEAVVARMREPAATAALEPPPPPRVRRWLVATLAAAAAAAAIGFVVWPRQEEPSIARGVIVAARPAHLALGPTSGAELDADAGIVWERHDARIVARQLRGTATWRVDATDTLRLDTGSDAGATVASVEATGASLRVEVQMNLMDVRTIGASAITSAAVALVTIVVYEGHVRVTGAGETVTVAPGTTVEVQVGDRPREQRTVAGRDQPRDDRAGTAACADRKKAGDAALLGSDYAVALTEYQAALACGHDGDVVKKAFLAACRSRDVAIARALYGELPTASQTLIQACAAEGLPVDAVRGERELAALDPDAGRRVIRGARRGIEACAAGAAGTWRTELVVAPDGRVTRATVTPPGAVATCLQRKLEVLQFETTDLGGRITYSLELTAAAPAPACDRDALEASRRAAGVAHYARALELADRAMGCGADAVKVAFLSACNLKNTARAKALYPRLPVTARALKQRCIQMGMAPELFP